MSKWFKLLKYRLNHVKTRFLFHFRKLRFFKPARKYGMWYDKHPYRTAFATCFVKGCMADLICQISLEKKSLKEVDIARNLRFSTYGGAYFGCVQHIIYNTLFDWIFPRHTTVTALGRAFLDQFVHVPFLALPAYCMFKGVLTGGTLWSGLKEYMADPWRIIAPTWKIWIPGSIVIFYFVPYTFRIAAVASLSLVFMVVLSFVAPMEDQPKDKPIFYPDVMVTYMRGPEEKEEVQTAIWGTRKTILDKDYEPPTYDDEDDEPKDVMIVQLNEDDDK